MAIVSIRRLVRATRSKLLATIGGYSHANHLSVADPLLSFSSNNRGNNSSSSLRNSSTGPVITAADKQKSRASRRKAAKQDASIPEALLIAARNNLPPVQFHRVHGPNAQLSKNKCVARRTQSFCQALVFSNRVILPNERVYIKVLEIAKGWSGTIRFGFTSVDPATLRYQLPKHACPDMTNAGHTWARALADEVVRRSSIIHFSYDTNGFIHYGINNQDCGIFYANVSTSQNLWFVVDIYGLTAAVELIDPRGSGQSLSINSRHNNNYSSSLRHLDQLQCVQGNNVGAYNNNTQQHHNDDDEPFSAAVSRTTMFKSTPDMEQLIAQYNVLARRERKKRKKATRTAAPLFDPWVQENLLATNGYHQLVAGARNAPSLPDLRPVLVASAQQNIYSPMPILRPQQLPPQLLHNENSTPSVNQENYYHLVAATANDAATGNGQAPLSQSQNNNLSQQQSKPEPTRRASRKATVMQVATSTQVSAVGAQLEELAISSTNNSLKSQSKNAAVPTATKRQKASCGATRNVANSDSPAQAPDVVPPQPAAAAPSRQQQKSSTPRHSTPKKRPPLRDNSNQSQSQQPQQSQIKDCPICFERPINCVLYQCGHMCTCYECGVKQWRTQSRSCPVCRTVIKDVIKAYIA